MRRAGFTRSELLACVGCTLALAALTCVLLGAGRSQSRELRSLSNLKTLAASHEAYAVDWGGRQFTNMPDNMAQSNGTFADYFSQFGCPPMIVLGFGTTFPAGGGTGEWGHFMPPPCGFGQATNFGQLWPMQLGTQGGGSTGWGMFRLQNIKGFNEYVSGRFMDPVFFAPADTQAMAIVGPGLESPNPYTNITADSNSVFTSYASSPAAMYHPGVFGGDRDESFKSPFAFSSASASPTVFQCAHPELKSRLIEYRWLQSPPYRPPFTTFDTAFFNMGSDSTPMTLFFDAHTAALPVRKVLADNDAVVKGGGAKLWMDTEITIGPWAGFEGFYSFVSVDDARTSFHVFTREGILGRDCLTAP